MPHDSPHAVPATYLVIMDNTLRPGPLRPHIACHYWTWSVRGPVQAGGVAAFLAEVREQSQRWANELAGQDDCLAVDLVHLFHLCPRCGRALLRDGNGLFFHAHWFLAADGMENNMVWYDGYRAHTCPGSLAGAPRRSACTAQRPVGLCTIAQTILQSRPNANRRA